MSHRGEIVYDLLRHVRPVVLDSARVVDARVRELGWTVGSRAVVEVLAAEGPLTVPQVAARLSLARQNVQRQVDQLRRLGHVEVRVNPAHRRSVLVTLTPDGSRTFAELHAEELGRLAGMARDCTVAELRTAIEVLAALGRDIHTQAHTHRPEVAP